MSNDLLRELSILEMPEKADFDSWALPNAMFPSDHLRVEAVFEVID